MISDVISDVTNDVIYTGVLRRLRSALLWDVRLQIRNGFYTATAVVLVVWVVIALWLPPVDLRWLLPALISGNLVINTFFFMAALVLLENDEGSLQARTVTPLRRGEYLAAKLISLSALALAENMLIVVLLHGTDFSLAAMATAILFASLQYTLIGFIAVARYDSLNTFLMPSILYSAAAQIPLIAWLVQWRHPLLYLHPLHAPLVISDIALSGGAPTTVVFLVAIGIAWTAVLLAGARLAFARLHMRLTAAA